MNILFVYPNVNGFHSDTYSFGLASIVSVARDLGHRCRVVIVSSRQDFERVYEAVDETGPAVVGFSSVSSQYGFVKELAAGVKHRRPQALTVCGGVHPTIDPRCLLESDHLDCIFAGESELSFAEFLQKVDGRLPYTGVENIGYREKGELKLNPLKPLIQELDRVAYPDRTLYPFRETLERLGYASFLFSRGCPYLCSYCSNHAISRAYGSPRNFTRYRSVGSAMGEIDEVRSAFPVRRILIVDDIFGLDKAWRDAFCARYRREVGIRFQCLLRANLIDEDFVRQLKDAGCYRISIGVESGNDHVRNSIMNRRMSSQQIIRAFDLARKYGIETNALNIIGVPGETEEMIRDTIRLNRRIRPSSSGCNVFYPYRGTVLGNSCFEKGLVDEEAYSDFSNERRETVLNFPPEFRRRLRYYKDNWEQLVYPFSVKRRLSKMLRNTKAGAWLKSLRKVVAR